MIGARSGLPPLPVPMPAKEAGGLSATAPARAEKSGRVSVWLAARRSTRSSFRSHLRLALGSQSL